MSRVEEVTFGSNFSTTYKQSRTTKIPRFIKFRRKMWTAGDVSSLGRSVSLKGTIDRQCTAPQNFGFVLLSCYNGWPSTMGLVSSWQPSTSCCCSQFSQLYCCIVENKPSLGAVMVQTCRTAFNHSRRELQLQEVMT